MNKNIDLLWLEKIDSSTITIDGVRGTESTYTGRKPTYQDRAAKMITWEKGDSTYLIQVIVERTDLQNTLRDQKANIDTIINSVEFS